MKALALAPLLVGCSPNWVDPMEQQPRAAPYRGSAVFADGNAMQAPPPSTVDQEVSELPEAPDGDGGVVRGLDPLPLTLDALERGQHQFDIVCAACHGLKGDGVSVVATKMALRPPADLQDDPRRALDDGQIFTAITDGYGLMPSFRARLSTEERWEVVAYVRALQLSQRAPVGDLQEQDLDHLGAGRP